MKVGTTKIQPNGSDKKGNYKKRLTLNIIIVWVK